MNGQSTLRFARRAAMVVLGSMTLVCAAGETVTYKGSGTYVATRALMPLANGGAAVHVANEIIATIAPSDELGFMFGDCAGLGYISPEGALSVQHYCTFAESEENAFDLRTDISPDGAKLEVIGGRGKWAGATGTGTVMPKFQEGDRGSYDYEVTITTP